MFGRRHDISASAERVMGWHGAAGQTNLSPLVLATQPFETCDMPTDDIGIDPLQVVRNCVL
jgi:hypothetical protein